MTNKTCGECKNFQTVCQYVTPSTNAAGCIDFKEKAITNGDIIRQGGDEALIDFADGIRFNMCHYCVLFTDESCVNKVDDCWDGVKAWLNAPAESEGKDE